MAKEKVEEKAPEEKKERFYVGEIATQTDTVIVDRKNNDQYTHLIALSHIMNELEEIKKAVLGG